MSKETLASEPHPVDIHVGNRMRMQRKLMGLSQEALARSIGVTFQQVQKYERGVNRMSASRLFDFAKVLQVPISFFFEGVETHASGMAEDDAPVFQHEAPVMSRDAVEVLRAFSQVREPALRRHIVNLVKAIAEGQAVVE